MDGYINKTYVGYTKDLFSRLKKHNSSKGAKFTRGSQWKLLHKEKLESKSDAMKREIELKKDKGFRSHLRQNIL